MRETNFSRLHPCCDQRLAVDGSQLVLLHGCHSGEVFRGTTSDFARLEGDFWQDADSTQSNYCSEMYSAVQVLKLIGG